MSITHRSPSFDLFRRRLRILGGGSEIQRVAGEAQPVLILNNAGGFAKTHIHKRNGLYVTENFILRPRVFLKVQFSLAYLAILNKKILIPPFIATTPFMIGLCLI